MSLTTLPCAPSGAAHLAPMAAAAPSMAAGSASGPITHGARAIRLTPMSSSRAAASSMLGLVSRDAASTGRASRAASSTAVTLAVPTASSPPTVTRMMPSAEVVMLNMRTRSARASPASASRWCSASASSALVLNTSPMRALTPVAAMASRSARNVSGCGVTSCGTITADGAPAGRRAAASASTDRIPAGSPRPPWSILAVRTSSAGLSTRSTVAMSAVGPVRPSSPTLGTARTSAGAPSGRLAGTGRRWRPPGWTSRACGCRTGNAPGGGGSGSGCGWCWSGISRAGRRAGRPAGKSDTSLTQAKRSRQ
jgi:hypothetical protein